MRLRDRVEVIVEAGQRGVSVGDFTWDVSDWDDPASTWAGTEPTFVALDGWTIKSVTTRRGRESGDRRHSAGTAQIVLVYRSPAGAWSFRPSSPVQLGMEMRVRVQPRSLAGGALGDVLPIYRGAIRSIEDGWAPDATDPRRQLFTITCQLTDRFADLAAVNLPEQPLAGLGDLSGARIARIMDLANIDPFYLGGDPGVVEHQSSNFARNLLDEAQVTAESETGDLYVDRDGFIILREQMPGGAHTREDVAQLTWANGLTPPAGSIAPSAFGTGQALDDVKNRISLARTGGAAIQRPEPVDEPTDQQLRYGLRTYQRFDLTCRFDADVTHAADFWLAQLQDRTQRVNQLQANLDPNMPDAQLVELLDIELRDRHAMVWTDGAVELAGDLNVQGIAHQIAGDRWTVSVNLWAYAGLGLGAAPARWSSGDVWGTATWG